MNPLYKGLKAAVRPSDRRPPWQWCEQHVVVDKTSPMPGKWRADSSPWVKELMEVFADNRVTDIAVRCSAQSSKTQTILNLLCWCIAEDPGPAMWVMAAKDEAKQFFRDRVEPTFTNCAPVNELIVGQEGMDFIFATMPLYFVGAGSPSKLQSKPIRWLFLDEVRNYPPGALDTVLKRTRAFWNSRRVVISTPDMKGDAVDRAFLAGDQRTFHFPCRACGQIQPLKLVQLRWDTNEETKPLGRYDFDKLALTIRYECVACGDSMRDVPADRKYIARSGRFIRMNPNAPRHRVSMTWNAILPPWVSWRSVVEEFIEARSAAKNQRDLGPLKTFTNETLGEPWEDQLGVIEDFGFVEQRKGEYDFGEPWAEERTRFMAADKQESGGEHYWYVIRSFGSFGKSRLVTYGRCNTKEELEQIRRDNNVLPGNAVMDSGFKAPEVYRFCAATGWKAFKGDDADFFPVPDPRTKKTIRQVWRRGWADPAHGTKQQGRLRPIPLFQWCNNAVKDLLAEYMMGIVGEWSITRDIGRDYLRQVTAERREEQQDTRGRIRFVWKRVVRDNHLFDCELMILAAAVITKTISSPASNRVAALQVPDVPA